MNVDRQAAARLPALRRSALQVGAFEEFYAQEAEALMLFFTRRTYDVDVAVDLTAETFAHAFAARSRFRGRTEEEARAWLYAIARGRLARFFRRGSAERKTVRALGIRVPDVAEDDVARIVDRAGLAELRTLVAGELERLSAAHREALRLRVVDELPYPEVAARLEISEQAARARVSRGLRALGAALAQLHVAEGTAR